MAPRTRRQHTNADTSSVATVTDTPIPTVSSSKVKGASKRPKLPRIVIKRPHGPVAGSEVSQKHPLSPEESPTVPTTNAYSERVKKPAKRAKAGGSQETRPPGLELELTDNEDETMGGLGTVTGRQIQVGVRKLKRTETLVQEDNSSLEEHCSHSSGAEDSDSESPEDDERTDDDVVGFKPTARLSQKLALERPSWPASATEDMSSYEQRNTAADGVLPPSASAASNCENRARNNIRVNYESYTGLDAGMDFEYDQATDLEHAGSTPEGHGQQVTHLRTKFPQFPGGISEGPRVTRKGSSKRQHVTLTRSEHPPVTVPTLGFTDTDQGITPIGQQHAHTSLTGRKEGHHVRPPFKGQQGACVPSNGQRSVHVPSNSQQSVRMPSEGQRRAHVPSEHSHVPSPEFTGTNFAGQQAPYMHAEASQATSPAFRTVISNDHGHPRSVEVPRLWPKDTDVVFIDGKMKLTNQTPIVRTTINKAFDLLQASIVLENAFPDTLLTSKFIQAALTTASLLVPSAEDLHVRIMKDRDYFTKMSILPRARISNFRSDVKEHCVAAVTPLLSVHSPAAIIKLVTDLESDFNFIFPRRSNNANSNALVGSENRSQAYRSTIIISVIRALYFHGHTSFAAQHQALFPSREGTNGDVIWEVPKAMVALVSTGYYATLREWITGERKRQDFTATAFLDAYNSHIRSLNKLERNRNVFYHTTMAEIYRRAADGNLMTDPLPSVPTLDLDSLEDPSEDLED